MGSISTRLSGALRRAALGAGLFTLGATSVAAQHTFQGDEPFVDDHFGQAVALWGNTVAIGAPGDGDGSVQVLTRSGGVWSTQVLLSNGPVLGAGSGVGKSLALEHDLLVIGADPPTPFSGIPRAFVYRRYGETWVHEDTLTDFDAGTLASFADSVALSFDLIAVGWSDADGVDQDTGQVNVYRREGLDWVLDAEVTAGDGAKLDHFGARVALHGSTLLVGAPGVDHGAVYVFERHGSGWTEVVKLTLSAPMNDHFGRALAIEGDTALIGAPGDQLGVPGDHEGRVYVAQRSGGTWTLTGELAPSDPTGLERFGSSVALHDRYAVVGALNGDDAEGSAYLFERVGGTWSTHEVEVLANPEPSSEDDPWALALWGGTVIAGAPDADGAQLDEGRAFAFDLVTPWSHLGAGLPLPGELTAPTLDGAGTLAPESPFLVQLAGAPTLTTAHLVIGTAFLGAPFKGGVMMPTPDMFWLGLSVSPAGRVDLSPTWPGGVPSGFSAYLQMWLPDASAPLGWAASNGLVATVP